MLQQREALALRSARAHVAARELEAARAALREALRLQPSDAEARLLLASVLEEQGSAEAAFLEYQTMVALHPDELRGWVGLATSMLREGLLEAPEAALERAVDLAPRHAAVRRERGGIRFRLGRYAGALNDAEAAVAAAPGDAAAWELLVRSAARSRGAAAAAEGAKRALAAVGPQPGLSADPAAFDVGPSPVPPRRQRPDGQIGGGALGSWTWEHWPGRMGEQRRALEVALQQRAPAVVQRAVEAAAREFPDTAFPPYLAGLAALGRGDAAEAERRLVETLEIAPRLPAAVAALGRAWAYTRGAAWAADRLLGLAARDPGLSLARYMAARAFVEAHDPIRAEAALRQGLDQQPGSPVPMQQLTDYYFGLDRAAEALDTCRLGMERFPEDAALGMMLAQIESGLGRAAEAAEAYEVLLARRPDLDLAAYRLGALVSSQEGTAAKARLVRVLRDLGNDRPSDPLLRDTLGWMLWRAGDRERARALLESAAQDAPEEPGVRFHLGSLYADAGDGTRARAELQAALGSPRPFAERIEALRLLRQVAATPAR